MKALLLGSSFSAVPIHNELVQRGVAVTVVGAAEGDPCHAIARESIFADYRSQIEISRIWENNNFDFLVPSCNDTAYETGTRLAAEFGLPGFDDVSTSELISKKHNFRSVCASLGLNTPKIIQSLDKESAVAPIHLDSKALIKPIDSFSGRGVSLAEELVTLEQIQLALDASPSGKAIVENFVEGSLHSHSAYLESGKVVWHEFVDEYCDTYPYQVSRSVFPSKLSQKIKEEVNEQIKVLAANLNLVDGLLHTQFIADTETFWLIEAMRRCPGDLFGHHFQLTTGFNYLGNYVSPFLGEEFDLTQGSFSDRIDRQVISADRELNFFGVDMFHGGYRTMFVPLLSTGSKLLPAPVDKAGILFRWSQFGDDEPKYAIMEVDKF